MSTYKVKAFPGKVRFSCTFNDVFIKLVGTDGESERTQLLGAEGFYAAPESVHEERCHKNPEELQKLQKLQNPESTIDVSCPEGLGKLLYLELDKKSPGPFPVDHWFIDKIEVTSAEGEVFKFPVYQWINDQEVHYLREGTAVLESDEPNDSTKSVREKQLTSRSEQYGWAVYKEGMPDYLLMPKKSQDSEQKSQDSEQKCEDSEQNDDKDLPAELQYSSIKGKQFDITAKLGLKEMNVSGLDKHTEPWTDFDSIRRLLNWHKNPVSRYVRKHWREDAFFGYQYLNGLNPVLIRRCSSLPQNFPVTDEIVQLEGGAKLSEEMEKGNIFLCDYKILDGVKVSIINGEQQYLAAPLVLFHKTSADELKPVAIQLKQTPADDNPIFFPSDEEYDWLTAKTFVRSADFSEHELNVHLLCTHLLAEVFTVALLRNIPRVHPLFKLLIPHTQFTIQINNRARKLLISDQGVFTHYTASGGEGMITILQRATAAMTYSSLCLPDDIKERGMESVPNYYYRDDGLRIWDIIHRFVNGVLNYYYKNDNDVQKDTELQKYVKDIFEHGFLSNAGSGIPQSFSSVTEVVKFVTMVIFTSSAQHSAVNNGQLDFGNWMPNFPTSLQLPPPSVKGSATEQTLLNTLPDVNTTVQGLNVLWLLTRDYLDFVQLGEEEEELFCEDVPRELIKTFGQECKELKVAIEERNKSLDLPYTYLKPDCIENSVAI